MMKLSPLKSRELHRHAPVTFDTPTTKEKVMTEAVEKSGIKRRGFGSLDKEKARAIQSKGGKSAHLQGLAHQFTSEEAVLAGRKGGLAKKRNMDMAVAVKPN